MIDSTELEIRERRLAAAAPRARSRRAKIGLVLLAIVLAVVVFETGWPRCRGPWCPRRSARSRPSTPVAPSGGLLTAGDPYLGFKLRPDVEVRFSFEGGAIPIRTTSYGLGPIGFRDIGTRAPFGAIVVGDSFTFCDEVLAEKCWIRRLSEASGVSMATLGVSGYSTLAEARILKRYGPAFGAPLVLVGVFPNDLADNVNFDKWARGGTDDLAAWLERERADRIPPRAGSRNTRRCTACSVRPCTRAGGRYIATVRATSIWFSASTTGGCESSPTRSDIPAGS